MSPIRRDSSPTAASLLKPGGLFLASTLNRTLKSFALAIVGAEYVLRWLEPGTHRWEQFVTPEEFSIAARAAGLKVMERQGVAYDPLRLGWRLSRDMSVNYLFAAKKGRAGDVIPEFSPRERPIPVNESHCTRRARVFVLLRDLCGNLPGRTYGPPGKYSPLTASAGIPSAADPSPGRSRRANRNWSIRCP